LAWAHHVPELSAWVLYIFVEDTVELMWFATREPVGLG
jgi:hypothetical protein